MTDEIERAKFERLVARLKQKMPAWMARALAWLLSPAAILIRLPLGLLLVLGGIFSFLPLLGIWMLPFGILLIAVDVPVVRRWLIRTWPKVEARWRLWRRSRSKPAKS